MLNWKYYEADTEKGYNFPFILIYPSNVSKKCKIFVESFNTAQYNPNNIMTFDEQIKDAKGFASWLCKSKDNDYSELYHSLNSPVIIPVIERCDANYKEEFYTQMLGRNAITTQDLRFKRLDLQVIAMIEEVKNQFHKQGIKTENKAGILGISASGVFAYRMAFLQPEHFDWVLSFCSNGLMPLPKETFNNQKLIYPLGTADYEEITGKRFNEKDYYNIKQFITVGKEEDNKRYNIIRSGILNSPQISKLWKDTYGDTTLQERFEIISEELKKFSPNIHTEIGEKEHGFEGKKSTLNSALKELKKENSLSL